MIYIARTYIYIDIYGYDPSSTENIGFHRKNKKQPENQNQGKTITNKKKTTRQQEKQDTLVKSNLLQNIKNIKHAIR